MSDFEKQVNLDLLTPVAGETIYEKVPRKMQYLKNAIDYTRKSGISTSRGAVKLLNDTFDREELGLFIKLAGSNDFISEEMVELAKVAGELSLTRPVEEEEQTKSA